MEKILFIREVDGDNIKSKESEVGRILNESDIPKCFGTVDKLDPECVACIVKVSCGLWKEKMEKEKKEKFAKKETKKEMEVKKMKEKVEEKKEEAKVEEDSQKSDIASDSGRTTAVDVEPKSEKVKEEKVEEKEKETEKPKDDEKEKSKVGKKPRGYVKTEVMKMLEGGTTRNEIKKFTDDLGYGEAGAMLVVRNLLKEGKVKEDKEKGVKVGDRELILVAVNTDVASESSSDAPQLSDSSEAKSE
jgi:hypothetical protein